MKDLISVIVPCYNVENYLEKCVYSIINQTYKNIEIILVNDKSTDKTGNLCERFKELDDRIIVVHNKENGGLSFARNVGIDIAKGKYIMFLDSDDFIDKNICKELLENIYDYNADISIGNRYTFYENQRKYIKFKQFNNIVVLNSEQAILELNNFKLFDMSACGRLYKKELFKDIKFPLNKISEDYFIMYKLFDKAHIICYNSKPYYYYFQRNNSITKSVNISHDFITASFQQMKFIEEKYPSLINVGRTAFASANMTIYNMYLKKKIKCSNENKRKFKNNVKSNLKYINKNRHLSFVKKCQANIFSISLFFYNIIFYVFKLFNKS